MQLVRRGTQRPVNMNFFCHTEPADTATREAAWKNKLTPYYLELGMDPEAPFDAPVRAPFDSAMCEVVEEAKPGIVSFHFGLPAHDLLARVKASGAKVISSATTVSEAVWLEAHGCDAIIAQGFEAGGHRGTFLRGDVASQVGTMALVPQVVDAVKVPVIAAGGIADARGIVAAFALGASAVQIGTAYMACPEAKVSSLHREALRRAKDDETVLTNVFTGRPARAIANRLVREVGAMSDDAPAFPNAAIAVGPLRAKGEAAGSSDFTSLWSGQAARLAREMPAGELTRLLHREALELFARLSGSEGARE
jgi:nitronate monooxygenase